MTSPKVSPCKRTSVLWRDALVASASRRDLLVGSASRRDPLVGSGGSCLIIHPSTAGVTSTPLRFHVSEGRACRVRCATFDASSRFAGRDKHAPPNEHDKRASPSCSSPHLQICRVCPFAQFSCRRFTIGFEAGQRVGFCDGHWRFMPHLLH